DCVGGIETGEVSAEGGLAGIATEHLGGRLPENPLGAFVPISNDPLQAQQANGVASFRKERSLFVKKLIRLSALRHIAPGDQQGGSSLVAILGPGGARLEMPHGAIGPLHSKLDIARRIEPHGLVNEGADAAQIAGV